MVRFVPPGAVHDGLRLASKLAPDISTAAAASLLSSGAPSTAWGIVPFALWCAGQFLHEYEEALWQAASGPGSLGPTCAMVGGIVALFTGMEGIPIEWLNIREPLAPWALDSLTEMPINQEV